ncbi:MAG TPA: hypothetical protein DCY14_09360, partial [Anaerolineae bacterium]|nr:hypothetical protein [Anaerolineae bacterium]
MVAAMVVKPFEAVEPDIILEKEMSLKNFGVDGEIVFTPGHTKGSLSVMLPNQEAIIGDVMMGGWMGGNLFGTRPNYHYFI